MSAAGNSKSWPIGLNGAVGPGVTLTLKYSVKTGAATITALLIGAFLDLAVTFKTTYDLKKAMHLACFFERTDFPITLNTSLDSCIAIRLAGETTLPIVNVHERAHTVGEEGGVPGVVRYNFCSPGLVIV